MYWGISINIVVLYVVLMPYFVKFLRSIDDQKQRNDARHENSLYAYDKDDYNTYEDVSILQCLSSKSHSKSYL